MPEEKQWAPVAKQVKFLADCRAEVKRRSVKRNQGKK
jgi:hypothetical protein